MDEEAGEFYVEPQQDQVREILQVQEPNPIYTKSVSEQPSNITLKMVEITREVTPSYYKPFKIAFTKTESDEQQVSQQFTCISPFTQFYSYDQLIYQKYNNSQFNRLKQTVYFPGSFVPKNLFFDYLKQDSRTLVEIIKEFYDVDNQNLPKPGPNDLIFDSNFQSGNLFAAFKISDRQYDLVMQNDNNSCGNNQWFYFSVQKLIPGAQFTFNVVNFTKSDSLFNYGMCPVAFSTVMNKKNETEWFRAGKDVSYKKGLLPRQNSRRFYYKVTFKITWRIANDKVYFAYTYPYTYTKICNKLNLVASKNSQTVAKVIIGKTLSKKNIQALIITQKQKIKKDNRKAIIIMARQHPGQTQGSFVCDGVIDKIIAKDSKQSEFLRKNFVIYIIPMINPDGVIFGHYRTNLAGKDLNRKWDSSDKQLSCPEVVCIKNFIQQISKQREIRFILDLHGHSKKLNSFFYGNPQPQNPQIVRIYPYICSKMHPGVQFVDCTFTTQQYKRKAARVYLSYLYKQIHVYTYEVSFYAFFKQGKKQQFNPHQFQALGHNLVTCLYHVLENQIKTQTRTNLKDSVYSKFLNELKLNKKLLQVGAEYQSGSESKPQQGQINQIPVMQLVSRKSVAQLTDQNEKKFVKTSRKGNRQIKQVRQICKPIRHIKFLQISRVNSVLPDRYQLGLQPIRKKQSTDPQMSRNNSVIKISSHCQTDSTEVFYQSYSTQNIEDCANLSSSIRIDINNSNQKRYSSLLKNTRNNNNIIFKIDFSSNQRSSSTMNPNQRKVIYQAFSQTILSIQKQKHERIKSSQLFPIVDSPQTERRIKKNPIKYETMKIGLKKQTQIFLNGMVKKFLIEKQMRDRQQTNIVERPLSIKRKQIYRK